MTQPRSRPIRCIHLLLLAILAASALACSQPSAPLEEITVAAYSGDIGALVFIAEEQGYFAESGLDVTIKEYEAGKLAADALLAGEADIATATEFVFVSDSFDNPVLRILGTIATDKSVELVARKSQGIAEPTDLKGKRIGVTKKSIGEFFLGRYLNIEGISVQEVELVDLKPSEIVKAVVNGEVDAGFTWDPNISEIERQLGGEAISWSGQLDQDFYFLLLTTEEWVETKPIVAERFLFAMTQAEEFSVENPAKVQQLLQDQFNYEHSYVLEIWPDIDFTVGLPQALLLVMENQARWRIANGLADQSTIPNYLPNIYPDALAAVNPEAVTIIQ